MKNVIKRGGYSVCFYATILTNTAIYVSFSNLRAQQISSIIFQCSVLYQTEVDFLWLFIHLCPRKNVSKYPAFFFSIKQYKGNTIWTGVNVVGPVMSLSVVFIHLYFGCQRSSHWLLLTVFSVTEDIVVDHWNYAVKSGGHRARLREKEHLVRYLA